MGNSLEVDIEALIAEVDALAPRAAIARETARLRRDEVDGSLAILGTPLTRAEVVALIDRGLALGGHPLDAYLIARSLADAAAWVWSQRPYAHGDPRPLVTVEEIRRLHTLATTGQPDAQPGMWRRTVAAPQHRVVFPPPWAVPFQTAAFVDRFRARPAPGALVTWLADLLARFARVRPFAAGNGRAGRLVAALVLRRLDAPPLAIPRDRAAAYAEAVVAGEAGDLAALGAIVSDALGESCRRTIAAGGDDPLVPLRTLAGDDYQALIKAAQRGRLRTVTRAHRIYTTAGWIAAYRSGN
jgi:Fic family protein